MCDQVEENQIQRQGQKPGGEVRWGEVRNRKEEWKTKQAGGLMAYGSPNPASASPLSFSDPILLRRGRCCQICPSAGQKSLQPAGKLLVFSSIFARLIRISGSSSSPKAVAFRIWWGTPSTVSLLFCLRRWDLGPRPPRRWRRARSWPCSLLRRPRRGSGTRVSCRIMRIW